MRRCAQFNKEIAELLIAAGADVNKLDDDAEQYPLHSAVYERNIESAKLLVEHGAKVNSFDCQGKTPLDYCFQYGCECYEIARYLKSKGGILNIETLVAYVEKCFKIYSTSRLELLIDHASWGGYSMAVVLKLLISRGFDINKKVKDGHTLLHIAATNGYLGMTKLLLENGADIAIRNDSHWTPMHVACNNGHLEVAEYLLVRGAVLSNSMLSMAAMNGHLKVVSWLHSQNALNINYQWEGQTALYRAGEKGHSQVVELLLEKGADKSIAYNGTTARQIAEKNGHKAAARLLN